MDNLESVELITSLFRRLPGKMQGSVVTLLQSHLGAVRAAPAHAARKAQAGHPRRRRHSKPPVVEQ